MNKKITTVVGARPQFIKLAPFSKAVKGHFNEIIIHTGQHYDKDMSEVFFKELGIKDPDYNLEVGSSSHSVQTARMMVGIENVFAKENPDLVVVFGDTNSTIAAALVASKMGIKIVHIEAGLRSFNRLMPEELNRVATDHLSDFLFAPTRTALANLESEGLKEKSFNTGDIMVDSVAYCLENYKQKGRIEINSEIMSSEFYMLTLHRPSTVDNPLVLNYILDELTKMGKKIIFPIHPRTKKIIKKNRSKKEDNLIYMDPLGYFDFLNLLSKAGKIITDSGGIQKEAYILKVPCVTLRTETEWIETVQSGWNCLIDPKSEAISETISNFRTPKIQEKLFGENVAKKMVEEIKNLI